jgi:hypothetical protein
MVKVADHLERDALGRGEEGHDGNLAPLCRCRLWNPSASAPDLEIARW